MRKPFLHDELEMKQHFLKLAREYNEKSSTLENELATALLYMNVADYLAEYLVVGLSEMASEAMSKYCLGVVTLRPQQLGNFNIGNSMERLKSFEFPRKADIAEELGQINAARKQIAHQMLKTSSGKLKDIDEAVRNLVDHTEKLVELVDEISPGMPPTTLIDKLLQENVQTATVDKLTDEDAAVSKSGERKK